MKYAYCKRLGCAKKTSLCLVRECEYYVETDDLEEYHKANIWKSERYRNQGDVTEEFNWRCSDGTSDHRKGV